MSEPAVIADFQAIYASVLGIERLANGRYPERRPEDDFAIPLVEYTRRAIITGALARGIFAIVTNSDGSSDRRADLLGLLGPGASERVIDPGIDVVRERLSVGGVLSVQCQEAIDRWYSRL